MNTALTQTEQREPGLWIAAQTVTVPVRLFGPLEVAYDFPAVTREEIAASPVRGRRSVRRWGWNSLT